MDRDKACSRRGVIGIKAKSESEVSFRISQFPGGTKRGAEIVVALSAIGIELNRSFEFTHGLVVLPSRTQTDTEQHLRTERFGGELNGKAEERERSLVIASCKGLLCRSEKLQYFRHFATFVGTDWTRPNL